LAFGCSGDANASKRLEYLAIRLGSGLLMPDSARDKMDWQSAGRSPHLVAKKRLLGLLGQQTE